MTNSLPIVIFTALPNELKAVEYHLTELKDEFHSETDTLYRLGTFMTPKGGIKLALVETEANNVKAASEVERALSYFKPTYAFFVGVAGGIKDVSIGDIVVATKIYAYETGKEDNVYKPRFEFGEPSHSLKQYAKAVNRANKWQERIDNNYLSNSAHHIPTVFLKPIAAGEKVIASTKSRMYKFLRRNCSDALAVAMEEYGFTESIKAHNKVSGIVVRGISDLIDDKSIADEGGSQEKAAANAAAFAFELLNKLVENGKLEIQKAKVEIKNETKVIFSSDERNKIEGEITALIAKGKVAKALDKLQVYFKNTEYHSEITALFNRHSDVNTQIRRGLITFPEATTAKNNIVDALLKLLNDIF